MNGQDPVLFELLLACLLAVCAAWTLLDLARNKWRGRRRERSRR